MRTKVKVGPTARQMVAAQAMADGMTQAQASIAAGLANRGVMRTKGVRDAVQQIADERAILAKKGRYGLTGAVQLYEKIADSELAGDADRIRAQSRIDVLMGLEAPAHAPTGDRDGILEAVAVIQALGLSANALGKLGSGAIQQEGGGE